MTTTASNEPTLADVIEKLDRLSTKVEKLSTEVEKLSTDVEKTNDQTDKFNDKFDNYQKATQWVVQLAFTLIASATITVIITSVFRK
ncbi:MAG: hypothetical protein EAZ09_20375 [Oscillatoriales cyanobacterium]|nr:MAG: hypothetical protein EAZ18_24845 [Oscillatoriales cyanobacterium]TAH17096.1 MAG: hypothetical protein EAZ09_20375 [Oscillatoriales cyanobacterium]